MPKGKPFKRLPTVDEYLERVCTHMDAHGISPDDPNRWRELALALLAKHEPDFQMEKRGKRARGESVPAWVRFAIVADFILRRRRDPLAFNEDIIKEMVAVPTTAIAGLNVSQSVIRSTVYTARRNPDYVTQIVEEWGGIVADWMRNNPEHQAENWVRDDAEKIVSDLSTVKNLKRKVTK